MTQTIGIGKTIDLSNLANDKSVIQAASTSYTATHNNFRFDKGTVCDNLKLKVMLTDSEDTNYEPYVGGIPSPNPEYPQDISSITGDVKITGKNLWGGFNFTKTNSGVTHVQNSDGTIIVNGTASGNSFSMVSIDAISNNMLITLLSGTYTLSGGISNVILQVVDSSGNAIADTRRNTSHNNPYVTFTIQEQKTVFVRSFVAANTSVNNETVYVQLERGSTPTPYEPYKQVTIPLGITELCKKGNVADKLVIDTKTGIVSKVNKIFKYIYTGDESITLQHSNDNGTLFNIKQPVLPIENYSTNYLNNYSIANSTSATNDADIGSYVFNGTYRIRVPNSIATTVEEFVTWLATANNTIYYPLATTTTETITTLTAEQLEILKPDDEENNYQIITNLGNMNIQIKYARDINKVIAILEQ